ncbi:MAG: hypothetical protein H6726_04435 [Sandaracinaceae bacterium]|nr:hypothetical protein [Myxococcales bacterium]MCB9656877.1 hypothetical protein [Sandaracinaceae bacterium]
MKLFLTLVIAVGAIAVPRSVRAQPQEPEAERASSLDTRTAAASTERWSRRTPVGAALVGGLGAAGGSVLLTYGIGKGIANGCPQDGVTLGDVLNDTLSCSARIVGMSFTLGTAMFPAAIAGGVTLGGSLAGGHGRYDMTLIGASLGTGLGWAFLAGMAVVDTDAAFVAAMIGYPVLQVAGALVAYHLSHRARTRQRERQFGPSLAPMRGGAVVGLMGRF